jgi:hypothetical protein
MARLLPHGRAGRPRCGHCLGPRRAGRPGPRACPAHRPRARASRRAGSRGRGTGAAARHRPGADCRRHARPRAGPRAAGPATGHGRPADPRRLRHPGRGCAARLRTSETLRTDFWGHQAPTPRRTRRNRADRGPLPHGVIGAARAGRPTGEPNSYEPIRRRPALRRSLPLGTEPAVLRWPALASDASIRAFCGLFTDSWRGLVPQQTAHVRPSPQLRTVPTRENRGAPAENGRLGHGNGTNAGAGSTGRGRSRRTRAQDQSHGRGEHNLLGFRLLHGAGPAPRARGAPRRRGRR